MLGPLRVEDPGAIYHLMSRGDHREAMSAVGCPKTGDGSASYISQLTAHTKKCRL